MKEEKTMLVAKILFVIGVIIMLAFVSVRTFDDSISDFDEDILDPVISNIPLIQSIAQENDRTNILFLGISGQGYISGNLTDSIIVISISHKNEVSFLFSIPRDLWVSAENFEGKINELYSLSDGTAIPDHEKTDIIKKEVEEITNLPMHYIIVSNLSAIEKVAKETNGITIDGVHFTQQQIVNFIRERNIEHSDFDRMIRHQQILIGMLEKLQNDESFLETAFNIYASISEDVSTNADLLKEASSFYSLMKQVNTSEVQVHSLTPATNLVNQQYKTRGKQQVWTLVPTAGQDNYTEIQQSIRKIYDIIEE